MTLAPVSASKTCKEAIKVINQKYPKKISHYVVPFFGDSTGKSLESVMANYKKVLVLDESMFGGLSSFCLKALNNSNASTKLSYSCHPNYYLKCGSYEYMLKQCKLDIDGISDSIEKMLIN